MAGGYLRSLSTCHFNPEESFVGQIWHNIKYLEKENLYLLLKCYCGLNVSPETFMYFHCHKIQRCLGHKGLPHSWD